MWNLIKNNTNGLIYKTETDLHILKTNLWLLKKAMAPHSSTLAWKIPWTEEPGRLQSMSDTTEWLHFHFSLSCIGEGNGNPLQYSCLENPRDGGAWWAPVYGVAESRTRLKWLSSNSSSTGEIGVGWGREWQIRRLGLTYIPWRIPWTEGPGGLQCIGSQRVRHTWSDLAHSTRAYCIAQGALLTILW